MLLIPRPAIPTRYRTPQAPATAPSVPSVPRSARLHAHARPQGADSVHRDAVYTLIRAAIAGVVFTVDAQVAAVRVLAREVQEVDAGEDGEEAAEEGDGVDGVGGVEAGEEDEGGDEGEGCEGYVVEGVDAMIVRNRSAAGDWEGWSV